jgi:hypothetical protein
MENNNRFNNFNNEDEISNTNNTQDNTQGNTNLNKVRKVFYDIPFKNISFRKISTANFSCLIDVQLLYNFFMRMGNSLGSIENFSTAFNCLDLTGCECRNFELLSDIINEFKIIKELNLTNTK